MVGRGPYKYATTSARQVPAMHGTTETFRIKFREYLGDIVSSASAQTWSSQTITVNAGLPSCFPFLSSLAGNFTSYKFSGLAFTFKPTSGESVSGANTAIGKIIMAFNYNPLAYAASNELELANSMWATVCKPSQQITCPVECSPKMLNFTTKYIRQSAIPTGSDARMFDMGFLQIATTGVQGTSVNLGELWVSYDVALLEPTLNVLAGSIVPTASYTFTGTIDASHYIGSTQPKQSMDTIGITFDITNAAAPYIIFPKGSVGTYWMDMCWQGNANTIAHVACHYTNCTTNATPLAWRDCPADGVASAQQRHFECITITDPSQVAKVQIYTGTTPSACAITSGILITQLNEWTV